jgi:menaquinol-cytochrome c reductase cytochrome b/c subunit
VNNRDKERYLREYFILKGQGKPFFPYAVTKDGLMACIVMLVIIVMSLVLGAELGPKADPTTTTYTPRPEWYFFFLFELLRVVKPPFLVFVATVGIPTICMASGTRSSGRSPPRPASSRSSRWRSSRSRARSPDRRPRST